MNLSCTQLLSTLEPVSSVARGIVFAFSQAKKRPAGLGEGAVSAGREKCPVCLLRRNTDMVPVAMLALAHCGARGGFPADRVCPVQSSGRSRGGLRWVRAAVHRGVCPIPEAGFPGFAGRTSLLCAPLAYVFCSWPLHEAKRPESGIGPILGVWKFPLERFLRAQSNPSFVT